MGSPYSPPVLYLTDDEDAIENERNISYSHPSAQPINDNIPKKRRKLTNSNVRINPSIINWSKRQHYDNYQQRPAQNFIYPEHHEMTAHDSDEYIPEEQDPHSFYAFDWTTELQTPSRIYSHRIPTGPGVLIRPPPPYMLNATTHHIDKPDGISFNPMTHQNDRYMQHRKPTANPMSSSSPPPLPLPLPRPTSSFIRPPTQRSRSTKNVQIPYVNSTPTPPSTAHHQIEHPFPQAYRPPSPAPTLIPPSTSGIRLQALNGTGVLSAFYDSKCYRCNICKFKSLTSSTLLQHLFTHMFFCHQCSFNTYSRHGLYQHIYDKHNFNNNNNNPKDFELLYATRCQDGTFALCMDSSKTTTTNDDRIIPSTAAATKTRQSKPKQPRKKNPKQQQKQVDNDVVILSEKNRDIPRPAFALKRPLIKEKQTNTYVLMKHRRCYSIRYPPCLHSLAIEYNICREHTVRHMCRTQRILKKRKLTPKPTVLRLHDEVAICLKTMINDIVNLEEKSDSTALIRTLPNDIIQSIFSNDDLNTITSVLKLNNKYDQTIEENEQNKSENAVRASNQLVFILSAPGIEKNEQSVFASLHSSITSADSVFTQTKLNKLPITCDNTHRFLKGNLSASSQSSTNSTLKPQKKSNITQRPVPITNPEPVHVVTPKPLQHAHRSSITTPVDRNNNPVAFPKSRLSPTPSVIVLD